MLFPEFADENVRLSGVLSQTQTKVQSCVRLSEFLMFCADENVRLSDVFLSIEV